MLARAVHQRMDALQVGIEYPLGFIVGMADVVSCQMPFAAHIAPIGHVPLSFEPIRPIFSDRGCYHNAQGSHKRAMMDLAGCVLTGRGSV